MRFAALVVQRENLRHLFRSMAILEAHSCTGLYGLSFFIRGIKLGIGWHRIGKERSNMASIFWEGMAR